MEEKKAEHHVSRRSFIKGAALGGGALAIAGMGSAKNAYAAAPPKKWDKETEVIVVGGGGAGLAAALSAHEAKSKVILLERSQTFLTSSTAISGGTFSTANGKIHRKMNIDYPAEKFYQDLMTWGKQMNIPELAKTYAYNSGMVLDWLMDHGVKITKIEPPRVYTDPPRGSTWVNVMVANIQKEKIPVMMGTRVLKLVIDPTKDRILGVEAEQKKKKIFIKAKKATILATGGFAGDFNLYDKILLDMRGGYSMSSPMATGDGLLMGQKIGADVTHLSYCAPYACGLPVAEGRMQPLTLTPLHTFKIGGVYINKQGKRFCNEAQPLSFVGLDYLPSQVDKVHFYIFDDVMWKKWLEIKELPTHPALVRDVENKVGKLIKVSENLTELASQIGVDPKNLQATVDKYNGYVVSGKDEEFGRTKVMDLKITKPPFYAMGPMRNNVALVLGGLRVNANAQALDPYGNVIHGLYAVGELMGGVHGSQYYGGTAVGKAFTFGYLAGKNAASEKL